MLPPATSVQAAPSEPVLSGKATAGFLLGCASLGLWFVLGPWALLGALPSAVLAFLARRDIARSAGRLTGASVANITFVVLVVGLVLFLYLIPAAEEVHYTAARMKSVGRLKALGIALHNYHKDHGRFPPPALYDKDGQPLLSWRVLLLPYIEEERLYQEFRLDEPWDSAHNSRLLGRMPQAYAAAGRKTTDRPYCTYYQVVVGKGTAFEGPRGVSLDECPNGPEKTLLIVEAGEPVPWTKPEDLPLAPDGSLPRLGGLFAKHFHAVFADASTHTFEKRSVQEEDLVAVIVRNYDK